MFKSPFSYSIVCSLILFSCIDNPEGPAISPSVDQIEMEAEGGIQQIDFSSAEWKIERIENVKSDSRIFGDIYSPENVRVSENVLLELEREGKLDAIWPNKGFSIVRSGQDMLEINLLENSSGEEFGFRVILSSESGESTITVSQKASQGYKFKEITYFVGDGDGDSLYWKRGTTLKLTVPNSQEIEFTPIGGIDPTSSYIFTSKSLDAFVWLKSDSVEVKLPAHFQDGQIYYAEDMGIYTEYLQSELSEFTNLKETITAPAGYSEFRSEYEMRRRILSYVLVLTNNRTGDEKEIEGKITLVAPTGNYEVISVE
ncbi:hypothetical protein PBT90_05945 [Algoriphagus halophytocola]|uniref:hypothetical protein n=1 Tax=Algoriphagus halophytocola TaxID=2991499 RepID=UPI0022DE339B|nr:hypothetical protein [Algoriphagus sp. TR-M9]WBL44228.1 hypothetical protein PBT90_05945 [Algoriphagus sp. TR-M9]